MYPNNLVVMFVFRKFGFEFIGGDQRVANATFSQSITTKRVSPLFIISRHSGFDTVPQQQKQRWVVSGVIQRVFSPRMTDKNTLVEHLKAVVIGFMQGNESALREVSVGGVVLYSRLP